MALSLSTVAAGAAFFMSLHHMSLSSHVLCFMACPRYLNMLVKTQMNGEQQSSPRKSAPSSTWVQSPLLRKALARNSRLNLVQQSSRHGKAIAEMENQHTFYSSIKIKLLKSIVLAILICGYGRTLNAAPHRTDTGPCNYWSWNAFGGKS